MFTFHHVPVGSIAFSSAVAGFSANAHAAASVVFVRWSCGNWKFRVIPSPVPAAISSDSLNQTTLPASVDTTISSPGVAASTSPASTAVANIAGRNVFKLFTPATCLLLPSHTTR